VHMTRIKDILGKTILPVMLGTGILVGYFFIDDRLAPREHVESCDNFYLSNSDYLITFIIIAGLGGIFKLTADRLSNKLTKTGVLRHVISILIFVFLFANTFLVTTLIKGKPSDMIIEVTSILVAFGAVIKILSLSFEGLFINKPDK
jgi:hypothetical protein